jgi:hypothetical protein
MIQELSTTYQLDVDYISAVIVYQLGRDPSSDGTPGIFNL